MAARQSAYWTEHLPALVAWANAEYAAGRTPDWHRWAVDHRASSGNAARMKYHEHCQRTGAPPDRPPLHQPPPAPAISAEDAERQRLEQQRDLRRERELLREVAGEKSFRAFLDRLVRDAAARFDAPPPYKPPKAGVGEVVRESMLQCLSDWHAYEIVDAERTRDFNAYNALVMAQRVRATVERHLSIHARLRRGGWRFDRLVVGCNGDFTSGTIHEVERHADAPSVVHAVWGTALVLAQALRDLSAVYPAVDVVCSPGNHGRLPDARKMQQKDPLRSWDALIYIIAREHLRDCPTVTWAIPNAYSVAFEVEGWRFLQTHGHDVRSWNQIPFYGLNRMVSNINALEAGRGTPIRYFLFGHFHNKSSLDHAIGEYFINGSLIGGTEYSVQGMGRADPPTQWMMGVHREHGVTHRWPLLGATAADAPAYAHAPWVTDAAA